jgi:hypothetical protein
VKLHGGDREVAKSPAQKKESAWGVGHWIATFVSGTSFVISVMAFYLGTFLIRDELRVDMSGVVHLVQNRLGPGSLEVTAGGPITFMNLGNRSAAVRGLQLSVFKPDPQAKSDCEYVSAQTADFHFQPFVVETSKIVIVDVGFVSIGLEGEDAKTDDDKFRLRACVAFDTATPAVFQTKTVMGLNLTHKIDPGEFITESGTRSNAPVTLISSRSNVFHDR